MSHGHRLVRAPLRGAAFAGLLGTTLMPPAFVGCGGGGPSPSGGAGHGGSTVAASGGGQGVGGQGGAAAGEKGAAAGAGSGGLSPPGGGGLSGLGGAGTAGPATGGTATGGTATGGAQAVDPTCLAHDIDVPSVAVSGTMTIGAAAVSGESGVLFLLDDSHLERNGVGAVPVAITPTGAFSTRVLPGTYAVFYGGSQLAKDPRNVFAPVKTGVVIGAAGVTGLAVDVPAGMFRGKITVGGVPVSSMTEAGWLSVAPPGTPNWQDADSVSLGPVWDGSFMTRLVAGTYDVYYAGPSHGEVAPATSGVKLKAGVKISPSTTTVVDLDVPVVKLSGNVTLAAAPSSGGAFTLGKVSLRGAGGDTIELGGLQRSYSALVLPGTYDVYFDVGTSSRPIPLEADALVPRNEGAKVKSGVVIGPGAPSTLDVEVPAADVRGKVTIAGATATKAADGTLSLSDGASRATLGLASAGSYAVKVIPGTYDLVYAASQPTTTTGPRNTRAVVKKGVVVTAAGPTVVDVDVPSVEIAGKLTIAGKLVTSMFDTGTLFLRTDSGDEVLLGSTSAGAYSVRALPGTYDLYYKVNRSTDVAPTNANAKLRSGVVIPPTGATTLDIDVPSVVASGKLTIRGKAVTDPSDAGELVLRGGGGKDEIILGSTYEGSYALHLVPGIYDLVFQAVDPGTAGSTASTAVAPRNPTTKLGCYQVR